MKKYLIASDKYLPLLKGYTYFFNKYWSDEEEVMVLCYKKPDFDLPENFKIHSLGNQSDYGKYWTNALIPFFKSVEDDHFMVLLDDLFPINDVDTDTLYEMGDLIRSGKAQKAFLGRVKGGPYGKVISKNIVEVRPGYAEFRNTIQPSIWNKEHFLKYLKPDFTIWEFELKNYYMSNTEDDVVIISKDGPVYLFMDVIHRGKYSERGMDKNLRLGLLKQEDFEIIRDRYSTFKEVLTK